VKYRITVDVEQYREGSGTEFLPVQASLDGDWICERFALRMDRYYSDYDYQDSKREAARSVVLDELGIDLIASGTVDQGVVTNASLFGGRPVYHSNSTPVLEPVVSTPQDVSDLERRMDAIPDDKLLRLGVLQEKRWRWFEERQSSKPPGPASGGTKGIATICGQLCGVTNFLMWLATNETEMLALTALVGRTLERYVAASRAADGIPDADGFGFASDLSGLMSPDHYSTFCGPHEGKLFERFAPSGGRFYHADSNMKNHIPALVDIGVSAVNIGPMVSAEHIYRTAPGMVVVGQVPPTQTLWRGSPDDVVDAVRRDVRDAMAAGVGSDQLVISTAGSINPGTPVENLRALHWAAMEYARIDRDGKVVDPRPDEEINFDRAAVVNQVS
jgi:uroporphyrinogen decarboxylase